MKKISSVVSNVIGAVCPELNLNVVLKNTWDDIVGNDFSSLTSFLWAKYNSSGRLCVFLNVLSSASVMFRYKSLSIKGNITKLLGVDRVDLVVKNVLDLGAESDVEIKDVA